MNKEDILIVCALKQETQDQLEGYDVLYTGVGKVNATYYLTSYLNRSLGWYSGKPELIINYGTGASKHFKGELVDCNKFIQGDMNVEELGFDRGVTPFEDNVPSLLHFQDVENPLRYDLTCYTADMFKTPNQYEDVVDMEAYALAKICYRNNISFISFKYITDEGSGNDWEKNCGKGITEFKGVLKYYVD